MIEQHGEPVLTPAEADQVFETGKLFLEISSGERYSPVVRRVADALYQQLKAFYLGSDRSASRSQRMRHLRKALAKPPRHWF